MEHDFDVIVVGSGAAGLSAAIEAREAGASVMLIEADTHLGGATIARAFGTTDAHLERHRALALGLVWTQVNSS